MENKRFKKDDKVINIDTTLSIIQITNIINIDFCNKHYDDIITLYLHIRKYILDDLNNNNYLNIILLQVGYSYFYIGKYEDALTIFNFIDDKIDLIINNTSIYNIDINGDILLCDIKSYIMGMINKMLNKWDDAINYFKKSLNNNKLKSLTYNNLLDIYLKKEFKTKNDILELIEIYKYKNNHTEVINYLYQIDDNQIEINNYIKYILKNIYIFMLDEPNIDKILDNFKILCDDDIIFLAEKYYELDNNNKIKELINNNYKIQKIDTKIIIKYKILLHEYTNKKLCEDIFNLYYKLDVKTLEINDIFNNTKKYYNDIIYNDINNMIDIKYPQYLNKKNLDYLNNEYCKFLQLKNMFNKKPLIDKCIICFDNSEIITLNCHNTHNVCYKCYTKINKCPLCRDIIYK